MSFYNDLTSAIAPKANRGDGINPDTDRASVYGKKDRSVTVSRRISDSTTQKGASHYVTKNGKVTVDK